MILFVSFSSVGTLVLLLSNNTKSRTLIKIDLENNNKLKFDFVTEKKKEKII